MSKRLTSLNGDWLELDEFQSWLEKGINTKTARCSTLKKETFVGRNFAVQPDREIFVFRGNKLSR